MTRDQKIKLIESMEANAHRLLNDAAALKEELSGGSGSSNSQVFSLSQKNQIIAGMRKRMKL